MISVTALAMTPVKGTRLHRVDAIELGRDGARGQPPLLPDRRARPDGERQARSASSRRIVGGSRGRTVELDFPGRPRVEAARRIRRSSSRRVLLRARVRPGSFAGLSPRRFRSILAKPVRLVEPAAGGGRPRPRRGGLADLARVARRAGRAPRARSEVDARRFRMLIEVDGIPAHVEDRWVGRGVKIGDAVVRFRGHVGRCLITSRHPETGEIDLPTLGRTGELPARTSTTTEPLPFGIYGEVLEDGRRVRVGDPGDARRLDFRLLDELRTCPGRGRRPRRDRHPDPPRQAQRAWTSRCSTGSSRPPRSCPKRPGVRAVVLHGDGPSFCSGLDVMGVMAAGSGTRRPHRSAAAARCRTGSSAPPTTGSRLPVPVIAAVHGTCFGGGLQIALAADIRIATPDARLSVMEIKWGLIPTCRSRARFRGSSGSMSPRSSPTPGGSSAARRPSGSGRDPRLRRSTRARRTSSRRRSRRKSPDAVRGAKRLLRRSVERAAQDTLALEAEIQRSLIGSPNQLAAVAAGMTKQPPQFTDPDPPAAEARGAPARS